MDSYQAWVELFGVVLPCAFRFAFTNELSSGAKVVVVVLALSVLGG